MLKEMRKLVSTQFKNNPSICKFSSPIIETITEDGIDFQVRVIEGLAKKPTGPAVKKADVFMPPFEEGLFLFDLTKTHRVVFNKFCVCDEHMVLITKEFED